MGFVIQMQRRAIERLYRHVDVRTIPNLTNKILKTATGSRLFVQGVSRGFGTCSQVHGVDVAVLGFRTYYMQDTSTLHMHCKYCVLVQEATPAEYKARNTHSEDVTLMRVELLGVSQASSNSIEFLQTGITSWYIPLY